MQAVVAQPRTLVLGIGNILLGDEGVGIHVTRALDALGQEGEIGPDVILRDGGTIGLGLISEIEKAAALVVIDAMDLGGEPGTVRTFQGPDMDRQLSGNKRTAHEVGLADLMMAAHLMGCAPRRRALVAIQPASVEWGLSASDRVRAAIPAACSAVLGLIDGWCGDL